MPPFTQHPLHKHDPTPIQWNALFSPPREEQTTVWGGGGRLPAGLAHGRYRAEAVLAENLFYLRFLSLTHDKPNG